jgi:hypothetical protein
MLGQDRPLQIIHALSRSIYAAHRLVSLWLFGDVAYAALPIIVLALLTALLGAAFHDFLLIKEWSFATIVFFGVSIRKLIRLKVEIHRTPMSYKLDTGVQLFVLLLIGAVLVLSLVILLEKGALPTIHATFLGALQMALFVLGLFSTFASVLAEDEHRRRTSRLPDGITRGWLLGELNSQLNHAADCLDHVLYALQRAPAIKSSSTDGLVSARRNHEKEASSFLTALDRITGLGAAARSGPDILKKLNEEESASR